MTEIREYQHEIPRMGAKESRGTKTVTNQREEMSGQWPEDRIVGVVRRFVIKCMDTGMSVEDVDFRDTDYTDNRVPKYPEQMREVQKWAGDIVSLLRKKTKLTDEEKSDVSDINSVVSEEGAGCSILLVGDSSSFKETFKDVTGAIFADAGDGLTRVDIEDGSFMPSDDGFVCFYSVAAGDIEIELKNDSIVRVQGYKGELWVNPNDLSWDGEKREDPKVAKGKSRLITRGAAISLLRRYVKRLESKKMPPAVRRNLERKIAEIKRKFRITAL